MFYLTGHLGFIQQPSKVVLNELSFRLGFSEGRLSQQSSVCLSFLGLGYVVKVTKGS